MRKFGKSPMTFTFIMAMDTWFELRKFAWSQEAARRQSKPSFLFSGLSAFSARWFNRRRILSCASGAVTDTSTPGCRFALESTRSSVDRRRAIDKIVIHPATRR